MPRKTITANVSLPPEVHAWVKSKIAAILEVEPAANPTFTSVVSEALRRAMNEEKQREILMEVNGKTTEPQTIVTPLTGVRYDPAKPGRKSKKA